MSFSCDDAKPGLYLDLNLDIFFWIRLSQLHKKIIDQNIWFCTMYEYTTYKHLFVFYLQYFKMVYPNVPAVLQPH